LSKVKTSKLLRFVALESVSFADDSYNTHLLYRPTCRSPCLTNNYHKFSVIYLPRSYLCSGVPKWDWGQKFRTQLPPVIGWSIISNTPLCNSTLRYDRWV